MKTKQFCWVEWNDAEVKGVLCLSFLSEGLFFWFNSDGGFDVLQKV